MEPAITTPESIVPLFVMPSSGSIGAKVLRPDALPGANSTLLGFYERQWGHRRSILSPDPARVTSLTTINKNYIL